MNPLRFILTRSPAGSAAGWRALSWLIVMALSTAWALAPDARAQKVAEVEPRPLTRSITAKLKPVRAGGKIKLPLITWGGDVATILAESEGHFAAEGAPAEVFVENNFPKQVERCLSGETPFLRGTMGMINAAAPVFKRAGAELVVICQLTWSVGGDAMVVRPTVATPADLRGRTIALQYMGPHMDFAANILSKSGVGPTGARLRWLPELTLPADDNGSVRDPVTLFQEDASVDAVMCIIPDAAALSSGGKVGTGAEGSVKGAKILASTRTASRIIADVYAVRADWLAKNGDRAQAIVRALERGRADLVRLQGAKSAKYRQLLSRSADLLLGASQATADVEGLLADCEFVGMEGNAAFFTGKGTLRNFKVLCDEIQEALVSMGIVETPVRPRQAGWDYEKLGAGMGAAAATPAKPRFDPQRAARKVESLIEVEPGEWEEQGTLFAIEINFAPNQSAFPESEYAKDYGKALEISQTYGGALVVIEGHSDPLGILRARQKGRSKTEIEMMERSARNLSLRRANAVRASYLAHCRAQGIEVDASQYLAVGFGATSPKFERPRTKQEWSANRRVVFRVKQVEAEMEEFVPLD